MRFVPGLDVAFSATTLEWWQARYAEGYQIMSQDLWTGGYSNNRRLFEVAEPNLRNAREAGFICFGYVNAGPWYPADTALLLARQNAGREWSQLSRVAVDVEIEGVTEDHVWDLCEALKADGKQVCLYSARWFWVDKLGNPQWEWLKEYPLWNAFYDSDQDIDFPSARYGPWANVIGEQYQGTTDIDGVEVDLNSFDIDWFAPLSSHEIAITTQEEERMRVYKIKGNLYTFDGQELRHIPTPEALAALGKVETVTLTAGDALLDLPVRYLKVPGDLRP